MIWRDKGKLSVVRQCALLGVRRSSLNYRPMGDSELGLALMRRIDRIFTELPIAHRAGARRFFKGAWNL